MATTAAPARTRPAPDPALPDPVPSEAARRGPARPRRSPVTALLLAAALLLGGFGTWAALAGAELRADSPGHNSALTDAVRTSEVKGAVTEAVNALFSYSYADPGRSDQAAQRLLTGRAVQQHATLLAQVKAQAAAKKLVLTTTVTDSAVQTLEGDRARVIVFADQRNTSTAEGATDGAAYSAAMFAVEAVHQGGGWRIENIDTFGR
ncbi:hypothetical protein [Kitasatospora sp. MBT63]|uniref:hypothetical protein n=1 Tax=Kitasatospora sp. MBT63 TaxID=1444768 RepID=UPI00053B58F6|nr:hypothetical protein [Kitasatospora sp. MBT63]